MKFIASAAVAAFLVASTSSAWALMKYNPGAANYNTARGYQRQYAAPKTDMPGTPAPKSRKRKNQH